MTEAFDRFDKKWIPITDCGCYLWTAAVNKNGYGKFASNGGWILAHRYAYERENGKIPEGLIVCHSCDNPSCVNVNHMFLGTHADNNKDRDQKNRNRQLCGEDHGRSKLTIDQVRELRELVKNGALSAYAASKKFGINHKTSRNIVEGKLWKHVA